MSLLPTSTQKEMITPTLIAAMSVPVLFLILIGTWFRKTMLEVTEMDRKENL
jgi:hypothetical protein